MLTTIAISPYIHVQGMIVAKLPSGQVSIDLDGTEYIGQPLYQGVLSQTAFPIKNDPGQSALTAE